MIQNRRYDRIKLCFHCRAQGAPITIRVQDVFLAMSTCPKRATTIIRTIRCREEYRANGEVYLLSSGFISSVSVCTCKHMWKRRKDLLPYLTQKTKTSCQNVIRKDTWPLSTRKSPQQHVGHIANPSSNQLLKRYCVTEFIFRVEYLHLLNHHPPQSSRAPQQPPPRDRTSTPPIFPFPLPASSILLYPTLFLSC